MRSVRGRLVVGAVVVATLGAGIATAAAQIAHPTVVDEHPVPWTPHVLDGVVNAITVVGDTVVVGGTFTEVTDATGTIHQVRPYLFGFGLHDGWIRPLYAELDGPVTALAPGPDGTVYLGGDFRTVNGVAQRGVTRLRVDTGQRVDGFRAAVANGTVRTLATHDGWLYVGGTFSHVGGVARAGLARLDTDTGAVDRTFDAGLTFEEGERVKVEDLAVAPDGRRLVAVGNFSRAHGLSRPQLVMLDVAADPPTVADWHTDAYRPSCAPVFTGYLRGVDFSPDGSWFVVVTTGGLSHPTLPCDTAARFEATGTGRHSPTWVNHTGGHSLYAVAVTGAAVYVGGHQRWMDNPHGDKHPGPGAVEREGIAALDPVTGRALPWNPGRDRGIGVQAFLATPDGLFVGSDTTRLGGEVRGRIGMFPLVAAAAGEPAAAGPGVGEPGVGAGLADGSVDTGLADVGAADGGLVGGGLTGAVSGLLGGG